MKKLIAFIAVIALLITPIIAQGSAEASEAKIDQNITMYVTVKVGGALDVRARILADYLTKDLGVNVTVENVPGAGGLTCVTKFLTNPSGPYDMIFSGASSYTAGPIFEPSCIYTIDDLSVIAPVDMEEFGLYVCPARTGFNSFDDVIEYAKNNEVIFGCGGIANVTYLYQAALYKELGFNYNTLIHNGGIEGITNCMGGHNVITMVGLETARPYVENGDIVPVLTFRAEDYTGYEGYTVPSVKKYVDNDENVYTSLMLVTASAKLDEAHANLLRDAVKRCLENPDCINELKAIGLNYVPDFTIEETVQYIKDEYNTLDKFVKQLM